MRPLCIVLAVMGLCACAAVRDMDSIPVATPMAEGPLVPAPQGWIDYCRRHAEDPSCR